MSAATTYATALFSAASEAGRLKQVDTDLAAFVNAIATSPELAQAIANPAVPQDAKRRVFADLCDGADDLLLRFLDVLLDHRRLSELQHIQTDFAARVRLAQNELAVQLTTAVAIDDATANKVQKQIADATGLAVTMERTVDPTILGGVVLRVRDRLVDASVRRRLELLGSDLRAARIPTA